MRNNPLKYLITLFCIIYQIQTLAQTRHGFKSNTKENQSSFVTSYIDSLRIFQMKQDTLQHTNDSLIKTRALEGKYYKLFIPFTFYHDIAQKQFELDSDSVLDDVDHVLLSIYMNRPDLVSNTQTQLADAGTIIDPTISEAPEVDIVKKEASGAEDTDAAPINIIVRKPNFWRFSGDYSMQVFQNHVSKNWYKGGESNYSLLGTLTLQANYNNKKKVKWENKLEMRLGFRNSENDTLHFLKTSEDLFRYTGKLGLQATKRWYYTMQVIATTQFMRGFNSNDTKVYSDFMSPFTINPSIGMDYGVDWLKGRIKGSIHLAPLAFNLKYCARDDIVTRFGIEEGKNTMHDFGSEFTIDVTWKFSNDISWRTRMYGYTSYKRVLFECENTFSFRINRYLSSTLFVYPRFDDSTSREERKYWQFNEYISIGFSYSF